MSKINTPNCQGHKKQGKSEELPHGQEKPKDTWQLNAMWCPGCDPGTEKRTSDEN